MRRFVQNFVLVPQSRMEYKVHMDIFRYLDEVWCKKYKRSEETIINISSFDT